MMAAVQAIASTLSRWRYRGRFAAERGRVGSATPPADSPEPSADNPWAERYARGGIEPPLDEVLRDPIVKLIMRADRVSPADLRW